MPNSGHSFFGAGGRGHGCCNDWNVNGVDAMANSGGGGSGAMGEFSTYTGGAGGSGIVVVEEYA